MAWRANTISRVPHGVSGICGHIMGRTFNTFIDGCLAYRWQCQRRPYQQEA
jgi:hypothetical protein